MKYSFQIKAMTEEEAPTTSMVQEKANKYGADSLSIQDCLTVLLGKGDYCYRDLSVNDLKKLAIKSSPTKSLKINALIQLNKHIDSSRYNKSDQITSPDAVYDLLHADLMDEKQELFLILTLNTKNRVIDVHHVFKGTTNRSLLHPREVFKLAIQDHAAGIICVHNHPSGDTTPSKEDISVTKRLVEVGKIVGIDLLDHVIIGQGYTSLKEINEM